MAFQFLATRAGFFFSPSVYSDRISGSPTHLDNGYRGNCG